MNEMMRDRFIKTMSNPNKVDKALAYNRDVVYLMNEIDKLE